MDSTELEDGDEPITAGDEATLLISWLEGYWKSEFSATEAVQFYHFFLRPPFKNREITGAFLEKELLEELDAERLEMTRKPTIALMIRICAAYCVESLHFERIGDTAQAWKKLVRAGFWQGCVVSHATAANPDTYAQSVISRRAADAAHKGHAENYAMQREANDWLEAHFSQDELTIDAAAEALKHVVPVAFSTRRSYVIKWKKSR